MWRGHQGPNLLTGTKVSSDWAWLGLVLVACTKEGRGDRCAHNELCFLREPIEITQPLRRRLSVVVVASHVAPAG